MNYEEMSDFEVNKLVAGIFLPCDYLFDEENKRVELANYQDVMIGYMHDQVLTPYQEFNPCNNPSDALPVIVDNYISLTTIGDGNWHADTVESIDCTDSNCFTCVSSNHFHDNNPLRAAMICFLKMKDADNGKH